MQLPLQAKKLLEICGYTVTGIPDHVQCPNCTRSARLDLDLLIGWPCIFCQFCGVRISPRDLVIPELVKLGYPNIHAWKQFIKDCGAEPYPSLYWHILMSDPPKPPYTLDSSAVLKGVLALRKFLGPSIEIHGSADMFKFVVPSVESGGLLYFPCAWFADVPFAYAKYSSFFHANSRTSYTGGLVNLISLYEEFPYNEDLSKIAFYTDDPFWFLKTCISFLNVFGKVPAIVLVIWPGAFSKKFTYLNQAIFRSSLKEKMVFVTSYANTVKLFFNTYRKFGIMPIFPGKIYHNINISSHHPSVDNLLDIAESARPISSSYTQQLSSTKIYLFGSEYHAACCITERGLSINDMCVSDVRPKIEALLRTRHDSLDVDGVYVSFHKGKSVLQSGAVPKRFLGQHIQNSYNRFAGINLMKAMAEQIAKQLLSEKVFDVYHHGIHCSDGELCINGITLRENGEHSFEDNHPYGIPFSFNYDPLYYLSKINATEYYVVESFAVVPLMCYYRRKFGRGSLNWCLRPANPASVQSMNLAMRSMQCPVVDEATLESPYADLNHFDGWPFFVRGGLTVFRGHGAIVMSECDVNDWYKNDEFIYFAVPRIRAKFDYADLPHYVGNVIAYTLEHPPAVKFHGSNLWFHVIFMMRRALSRIKPAVFNHRANLPKFPFVAPNHFDVYDIHAIRSLCTGVKKLGFKGKNTITMAETAKYFPRIFEWISTKTVDNILKRQCIFSDL